MSDYLAHLVERSFAPAPRIRPQVASRFEKPSATVAFDPAPQTNEEPQRSPFSRDTPQPSFDRSAETDNAELNSLQPISRASIATPHAPRADSAVSDHQLDPAGLQSEAGRAPVSSRPIRESMHEASGNSSRSHPGNEAQPRSQDTFSVHLRAPSPARSASPNTASTTPDALEVRSVIRPSSAPNEPLYRSAFEQGREKFRSFAPSASSPSEPSIQVTIGRVEVRVTPPAAPTKSASRKEPALSLDAYLRRRSQGGGR
jgi:hypothetical protein